VAIPRLLDLVSGRENTVEALAAEIVADRQLGEWHTMTIRSDDFVPVRDNYWLRGTLAAQAVLAGGPVVSIDDF
jgi:hypothetical protein